jgi:hypothetical protein
MTGGAVPTAGAAAAKNVVVGGKESDKRSRARSMGKAGFGIGRLITAFFWV